MTTTDMLAKVRETSTVAVDGTELGGPWLYHRADAAGMRLEHIEADLSARRDGYQARARPRGVLGKYLATVSSASEGAVTTRR